MSYKKKKMRRKSFYLGEEKEKKEGEKRRRTSSTSLPAPPLIGMLGLRGGGTSQVKYPFSFSQVNLMYVLTINYDPLAF